MINYNIEAFRQNMYDMINQSQLPLGVLHFIMKDIYTDITTAYQNAIQQEIQQAQAQEAEATATEAAVEETPAEEEI